MRSTFKSITIDGSLTGHAERVTQRYGLGVRLQDVILSLHDTGNMHQDVHNTTLDIALSTPFGTAPNRYMKHLHPELPKEHHQNHKKQCQAKTGSE